MAVQMSRYNGTFCPVISVPIQSDYEDESKVCKRELIDKSEREKMADRMDGFFECAFVNCNPWHRQQVFDSSIIGEFTRNDKTLLLVTECYHSRVEVIAELFNIKRVNDVTG